MFLPWIIPLWAPLINAFRLRVAFSLALAIESRLLEVPLSGNFSFRILSKRIVAALWVMMAGSENEANAKVASPAENKETDSDGVDVGLFQNGKEAGFNRLVLRHKDKVFSLCFRMLGNREQALDAAQEVFVRMHKGLGAFRGEARFSTWLHTLALNACRNRIASAAYRRDSHSLSLDTADESHEASPAGSDLDLSFPAPGEKPGSAFAWTSGAPDQDLLRHRREALLQKGIAALPPDFREVLVLRDVQGHSYEEVALLAGLDLGTVKSRLNRAREKLRDWLKEVWE